MQHIRLDTERVRDRNKEANKEATRLRIRVSSSAGPVKNPPSSAHAESELHSSVELWMGLVERAGSYGRFCGCNRRADRGFHC